LKEKYRQSVTVRVADDIRVKADGVVIFPHEFEGNTVRLSLLSNGSKMESTLISSTSMVKDWQVIISAELITFVSFQQDRSHAMSTIYSTSVLSPSTPLLRFSKDFQPDSTY